MARPKKSPANQPNQPETVEPAPATDPVIEEGGAVIEDSAEALALEYSYAEEILKANGIAYRREGNNLNIYRNGVDHDCSVNALLGQHEAEEALRRLGIG